METTQQRIEAKQKEHSKFALLHAFMSGWRDPKPSAVFWVAGALVTASWLYRHYM